MSSTWLSSKGVVLRTPSHLRAHVRPRIAMIEIIAMDPKQVISLLNSFGVILNLHCILTELEFSLS
jgi:hypothetical protein